MPLDRTGEVLGLGWGICGQQEAITMGNLQQSLCSSTSSQFNSELQISTNDGDLPGVTW